ncbi:ABC transporter ATP-binding protein [Mycoplasmopsis caviae]|uniref:ABC transporter n=1 Tax=Mycoplasmopsis caviae TaxID=55603 RepID=A0A3P8LI34_9BACT|nr:ABC transporter ATP-binding protein [Mycoplasmopsis caviae]UUD35244.1 ABC transporter ATP-binding protein [Mycoplasmopsis caviae]VDR41972.1 ABC transporter [Mycoplasmopsis caviae]
MSDELEKKEKEIKKSQSSKTNKKTIKKPRKKKEDTNLLQAIIKEEQILEEQISELEIDKNVKITKENVFELLDKDSSKKNIVVPKKVRKLLVKLSKRKRKKDGNENLKNSEGTVIEVKNVSKYYVSGNIVTRVLKDVSVDIKKGELMLIFGVSGGGKSTLLNLISGLDRPSKGQVIVCDNNLPYMSDSKLTLFRRKHLSFIFQNYNLLANLNAFDNVQTGAYLQKDPAKKVDIVELFKEFEMEEEISKFPSQMSGGQQQRVSIMRALAKNSDIIFADEPTGALDEATTKIVLRFLYNINKETGATVVMVSHNPIMAQMADRIIHVVKGRIDKVEVNQKPTHPDDIDLFKMEK